MSKIGSIFLVKFKMECFKSMPIYLYMPTNRFVSSLDDSSRTTQTWPNRKLYNIWYLPPKQTANMSNENRAHNFMGSSRKPTPRSNAICLRYMSREERWKMTILFSINRAGLRASAVRWSSHTGMSDGLAPHQSVSFLIPPLSPNHLTAADVLLFIQNYN